MSDQINKGLLCLGISKTFDDHKALDSVTLTAEDSEIVAILGPSGCGKTTLLRIIAGLELPDAGTIWLDDINLTKMPASKRPFNMVFQSYALFPHLDVYSNVAFGLEAQKKFTKVEIKEKVLEVLDLLQIKGLVDRYPKKLSGGQQQRVALARALVNEPRILLLDEPMSALDAHLRAQVQDELRVINRELGTTFVLVTHDHNEAKRLSHKLIVMKDGQILQSGRTQDVFSQPESKFVAEFLGATNFIPANRFRDQPYVFDTPFGKMKVKDDPKWDKGKMLIWPTRIQIRAEKPDSDQETNWFTGQVTERVFNGEDLDVLLVKVPDDAPSQFSNEARIMAKAPLNTENGQQLAVHFPPDDLVVLDKNVVKPTSH